MYTLANTHTRRLAMHTHLLIEYQIVALHPQHRDHLYKQKLLRSLALAIMLRLINDICDHQQYITSDCAYKEITLYGHSVTRETH